MIGTRPLSILQELINIGVGKGAVVLNTLLGHHVVLDVPEVNQTDPTELIRALALDPEQELACVQMGYRGALQGEVQLLFPAETAAQLVALMIGENHPADELDFIRQATLTEVGNIVINAVVGTLSNLFGFHLQYTLPTYHGGTLEDIEGHQDLRAMEIILLAKTKFTIEELSVTGNMVLFFSLPTFQNLEEALEAYADR
jgi:chemotaxis protein CheC